MQSLVRLAATTSLGAASATCSFFQLPACAASVSELTPWLNATIASVSTSSVSNAEAPVATSPAISENSVHGSDGSETAPKEIAQFFSGKDIVG